MMLSHWETCGRCHSRICNCLADKINLATVIVQELVDSGYTRDSIIAELIYREFSMVTCIAAVAKVYGIGLDNAKDVVSEHPDSPDYRRAKV